MGLRAAKRSRANSLALAQTVNACSSFVAAAERIESREILVVPSASSVHNSIGISASARAMSRLKGPGLWPAPPALEQSDITMRTKATFRQAPE